MALRIEGKLWIWASELDEVTRAQAHMAASLSIVQPHLALMPDAHLGKGSTIGSVIPTVGAVLPSAVGVDIGCGMLAVRTDVSTETLRARGPLVGLREAIEEAIPVSAGHYRERPVSGTVVRTLEEQAPRSYDDTQGHHDWRLQLGTLGGGNHFIEVSEDEAGQVWVFLHSGSRGIGNRIATEHIQQAENLCRGLLPAGGGKQISDLAQLLEGTASFDRYIADLRWAQDFAARNREAMMEDALRALERFLGRSVGRSDPIACCHNYTRQETHFGEQVWLTRKGAISAQAGEVGLIPGSMGTASYVVEGLGNRDAFCSAPHGAGRRMSRGQAKRSFDLEDLASAMEGIEYRASETLIDEHPGAYKGIAQVMEDARDLVTIRHTLHQLVNVKGD